MAGRVDSLFTSASDGDSAPMTSHASVECIKGVDIAGDRYAVAAEGARFEAEQNTHWHLPEVGRQLTLFDTGQTDQVTVVMILDFVTIDRLPMVAIVQTQKPRLVRQQIVLGRGERL